MLWTKFRTLPLNNNQGYSIELTSRGSQGEGRPAIVVANSNIAFSWSRMDESYLEAQINPGLDYNEQFALYAKQGEKQVLRLDIPSNLKNPILFIYNGKVMGTTYLTKPLTYPLTLYLLHRGESGQTEFNQVTVKNYEIVNPKITK